MAYDFKKCSKGARQIKMTLAGESGIIMNLKCIRRLMKKFGIVCTYRKPNPYKRIIKATREHTVVPNHLVRNFRQGIPGKVLLTDITYVPQPNGKWAYLSTIKDGSTNQILVHNLSQSLEMPLVTDTLMKLRDSGPAKPSKSSVRRSTATWTTTTTSDTSGT